MSTFSEWALTGRLVLVVLVFCLRGIVLAPPLRAGGRARGARVLLPALECPLTVMEEFEALLR